MYSCILVCIQGRGRHKALITVNEWSWRTRERIKKVTHYVHLLLCPPFLDSAQLHSKFPAFLFYVFCTIFR